MLFSTSNSDHVTALRAIKVLLLLLVGVLLSLELGARYLVPLVNWNMRRFHAEGTAASMIGAGPSRGKESLLFLGNSLTLSDIDLNMIKGALGATNEICRWSIDDTNYLDWYYGLRRIYRNGGRPNWVVIGARSRHLLAGHVRGRFFAHYILGAEDLANAAKRTGVDATGFSNMILAQISSFYGSREEIFKRCITLVIPSFPELGRKMTGKFMQGNSAGEDERLMRDRFRELNQLGSVHGSRMIIWIPPTPEQEPLRALMIRAGAQAGIPVVALDSPGEWTMEDFKDGYHMTPQAAERFSKILLQTIRLLLAAQSSSEPQ